MTKPKPFQEWDVNKAANVFAGRVLLAHDMGLGKTFMALLVAMELCPDGPIVVVCPAGLKVQWEQEARRHVQMTSLILEGTKARKITTHRKRQLVIVNYDVLHAWVKAIRRLKPAMIIFDEGHKIKNRTSRRFRASKMIAKGVKHLVILTGTPIVNNAADLWTLLHLLDPETFKNFTAFAWKYTRPKKTPWKWVYQGVRNRKELHELLYARYVIRRLTKDVQKQLPSKKRIVVPVPIEKRKEYDALLNDFRDWLRKDGEKASRVETEGQWGKLYVKVGQLKLKYVFEWIDNFLEANDGKLLVFGIHRKLLEAIHQRYSSRSVLVYGGLSQKQREVAKERFRKDEKCRLFVGNIHAAGVGLNLTEAATGVFVELSPVPADMTQAEKRNHRMGQTERVRWYWLVAHNTIEEKLCRLIQGKQRTASGVIDGDVNVGKVDVFSQLLREVAQ